MQTAYEAVFILETTLGEEVAKAIVEKYTNVITNSGGVVDDVDRWDPRRLAYEIKGKREGVYYIVKFHSEPAARAELDRIFRISDDVLRYIIVKQDKRADSTPSRGRAIEMERREREQAARLAAQPAPPAPVVQPVTDLSASNTNSGVSPVTEETTASDNASPTDAAPTDDTPTETASAE